VSRTDAPPASSPEIPRPSRSQSMQLQWRRMQHTTALPVVMAAIAALVLGVFVGRTTAPTVDTGELQVVERDVVALAVDADALWTAGGGNLPAVSLQLQELRQTGDPGAVLPYVEGWLAAYDTVLLRLVGVDVPPPGRPVQRQVVTAVTLNRDAVEVLGAAAEAGDPQVQRDLTSEALRLRIRAEEVAQTAQASLADLRGGVTSGVSEPRDLPGIDQLR
jgi:hypothetical protein